MNLPFNRALRILLVTNGLILIAAAMLGPIYALFVEEVGGDLLDASFAGGAFAIAAGITVLITGRCSDNVRESELIVVGGYAIMGISFFLYAFVSTVWMLLCIQILIGLGEALYSPAFDGLYSKHLDAEQFGTEWGAWEATNYFTTAIGAITGGFIVTSFGFEVLFYTMSALCFASALYILFLPRRVL